MTQPQSPQDSPNSASGGDVGDVGGVGAVGTGTGVGEFTHTYETAAALNDLTEETFPTDTGNGRRFVRMYGDIVRYVKDLDRWYVWNGRYWQPDTPKALTAYSLTKGVIRDIRAEAMRLDGDANDPNTPRGRLMRWAIQTEGVGHRRRILEEAMSKTEIQTEEPQFDSVDTDLVVLNGIVDLKTGNIRKATPADLNSRSCTVAYRAEAAEPGYSDELENYLETFLPDPLDQRFVFAVLGRALIAGNKTRTFPIILGGTTSGKSQLIAAVHKVIGTYACAIGASVFRGNLDDKPRPDLVKAMYTRLAYATEASKSWSLHGDQIKRLTGGDAFPYRNLYDGTVNAYPRFTPLIVSNEMPRIPGADTALKRRILVMKFDRTLEVGKEDPKVKQRFLNDMRCLEAILARLVAGARDPITEDVANIPERYALATMNAFGELDHVEEFLQWMKDMDALLPAPEGTPVSQMAKASELYDWYSLWVKRYGDKIDKQDMLGLKSFGQKLRDDLGWESKTSAGVRWVGWTLKSQLVVLGGMSGA